MLNHDLRVAIYARVSGEQQAKDGDDRQPARGGHAARRERRLGMRARIALRGRRLQRETSWSARASNDFGTRPPPVSSIASTSSIQIDFHANMHIKF